MTGPLWLRLSARVSRGSRVRGRALLSLGLALMLLCAAAVRGDESPVAVTVSPLRVKAGQSASFQLRLKLAPGWHVFGSVPLVEGVRPTTLTVAPVPGVAVTAVRFPSARKVRVAALGADANVYEGTVGVTVTVKVDAKASPGPRALDAVLSYQACSDVQCRLPKKSSITLPLTIIR